MSTQLRSNPYLMRMCLGKKYISQSYSALYVKTHLNPQQIKQTYGGAKQAALQTYDYKEIIKLLFLSEYNIINL